MFLQFHFTTSFLRVGALMILAVLPSRQASAQQAFCVNPQNDPQCDTFLRTQRARCEGEGRVWDSERNECRSVQQVTGPIGNVVRQGEQDRERMAAPIQQARNNAQRVAQALDQVAGDSLPYIISEADFPGQSVLIGLPRHLGVFTQNFLPTLFYEKIRENSWFTPYDIELPEQDSVEIYQESHFGCQVRASYRILEGSLSVGYEPETTQIEVFPKVGVKGRFQVNQESQVRVGGRVRVRLNVQTCASDSTLDFEMLVNRLAYSVRAELAVTRDYFYVADADLLNLTVGGPSDPDSVTVRQLTSADIISGLVADSIGLEALIRRNIDSVIQGPMVKGRIQDQFTAFLPSTVKALSGLSYLGEPYPGIVTQIQTRQLGQVDSMPGLISAFSVDIGNMRNAGCARNLSNGAQFYRITRRPGVHEDAAFMSTPYHLITDTVFAALKSGAACLPIPELRYGNFRINVEPGFSGKLKLKTLVFGVREGNIKTGMKWGRPLERRPDDPAASPVSLEIPLELNLTARTVGISAPGASGIQSSVRTTVTAPLRLWFDRVNRQFMVAIVSERVTYTPFQIDNPIFARQWNRLPLREEKTQEILSQVLSQIPPLGFSPSYTSLDSRFEARVSRLIFTPVDVMALLSLECVRECLAAPIYSLNGSIPHFSPAGTEAVRDEGFRLRRFLTDPGATDRIPGKLECPRPNVALHAEHGITYGDRDATACKACVKWSGNIWDLSLRQCIRQPCTLETLDEERSSCMICEGRERMSWSVNENRCGVYHLIEERFAVCREEPGYRARFPGALASRCISCVSGGGSWNSAVDQCVEPRGVEPRPARRAPVRIE